MNHHIINLDIHHLTYSQSIDLIQFLYTLRKLDFLSMDDYIDFARLICDDVNNDAYVASSAAFITTLNFSSGGSAHD